MTPYSASATSGLPSIKTLATYGVDAPPIRAMALHDLHVGETERGREGERERGRDTKERGREGRTERGKSEERKEIERRETSQRRVLEGWRMRGKPVKRKEARIAGENENGFED